MAGGSPGGWSAAEPGAGITQSTRLLALPPATLTASATCRAARSESCLLHGHSGFRITMLSAVLRRPSPFCCSEGKCNVLGLPADMCELLSTSCSETFLCPNCLAGVHQVDVVRGLFQLVRGVFGLTS